MCAIALSLFEGALKQLWHSVRETVRIGTTGPGENYGDDVASMAWHRHAIAQTQLRRRRRVDGVGRLKFDFHTGTSDVLNPKLIMPPELPKLPPVCEGKAAASPGGGHAQIWSVPPRGNHGFRSLSSRYFQWFSVLNSSLKSKTPHHKL